jgi:hypothetical protein
MLHTVDCMAAVSQNSEDETINRRTHENIVHTLSVEGDIPLVVSTCDSQLVDFG